MVVQIGGFAGCTSRYDRAQRYRKLKDHIIRTTSTSERFLDERENELQKLDDWYYKDRIKQLDLAKDLAADDEEIATAQSN